MITSPGLFEEHPVYITYYSQLRTNFTSTAEEIAKEIAYEKGRRVTKLISSDDRTLQASAIKSRPARKRMVNLAKEMYDGNVAGSPTMDAYIKFKIPKASGGFRQIVAPNDELKQQQQQMLKILTKEIKVLPHNAAHGFTTKRNCKTSLEVHQKAHGRWFLKMDIKNFFQNITAEKLMNTLPLIYPFCYMSSSNLSKVVRVCTIPLTEMVRVLPQGAPTSPFLANIVMVPVDYMIADYCKANSLCYTRYADDILISSPKEFDYRETIKAINAALDLQALKINPKKTRYGSFSGRNWNLGLMYNSDSEITVGHAKKKLIKSMVHNFATKPEYRTPSNAVTLQGQLAYCSYIEPEYFAKYLIEFKVAKAAWIQELNS